MDLVQNMWVKQNGPYSKDCMSENSCKQYSAIYTSYQSCDGIHYIKTSVDFSRTS